MQLNTKSKIFCPCMNPAHLEKEPKPNSLCCPMCLGLPGAKPVFNKNVLEKALKVALALGCKINEELFFSRKIYFYPDLPNNYQITQYEEPLGVKGVFQGINITRIHMEEDPGKLIHEGNTVLIDYNRCGTPLVEVVTEPDFETPEQTRLFLQKFLTLLEYLSVYDRKSEASLRVDANISTTGERVEIKNIGSIKDVEKALNSEIERQKNNSVKVQETRGWNADLGSSVLMRTKETEEDYGYIFEPNLTRIVISQEEIEKVRATLPELQDEKAKRFVKDYSMKFDDARVITSDLALADLFERVAGKIDHELVTIWFVKEIPRVLNYNNLSLSEWKITEKEIIELLNLLQENKITKETGRRIIEKLVEKIFSPQEYVQENNLLAVSSEKELEKICQNIIDGDKNSVESYKKGEEKALHFLMGKVMRESRGKADPYKTREILKKLIENG